MNQRNRDRDSGLSGEIEKALGGERPRPRQHGGQAHSGNYGVSIAGANNHVHYYGGGPATGSVRRVWTRVWAAFALAFFLAAVWLQVDMAAWHATSDEPHLIRIFHAVFAERVPGDLILPVIVALVLGGAATIFLRWLWTRI